MGAASSGTYECRARSRSIAKTREEDLLPSGWSVEACVLFRGGWGEHACAAEAAAVRTPALHPPRGLSDVWRRGSWVTTLLQGVFGGDKSADEYSKTMQVRLRELRALRAHISPTCRL